MDIADKAELDKLGLKNPDEDKQHFFDWPDNFLQAILGSLLCDEFFLLQGVDLIKPEYFRENAHRFICRAILEYYREYGAQPTPTVIEAQISEELQDSGNLPYYRSELQVIQNAYEPGLEQREFFLDKITEFAKTQALRLGYHKTLGLFNSSKKDKWAQIRSILEEAFLVERNIDLGLDYFETIEERYERARQAKDAEEFFPTGFDRIDTALDGGLCRGEIGAFAGMSGAGKSLALVKAAKSNLMKGWNVLVVSLELDEDTIAERFDAMLTQVNINSLYAQFNHVSNLLEIEREKSDWGKLVIKQFPAGTADVSTVRAYLAQLHLREFYPDLIVVDYVGEFRDIPGIKTYESRQRLVRDLRGMAVELKVCVLTAMQVNRGGRDAINDKGYIDDDSLADSAGQIRPLDALWTISQTDKEQLANCGTLFASKHRSGEGRFSIQFQRDPNTLEMNEISYENYQKELSKVENKTTTEVGMEGMAVDLNQWKPNAPSE